jgi:hypothetical protein
MLKITGLNELQRTMDELAKFGADLDGEIAQVTFNPTDPTNIEAAIQEVADAVDAKAKSYPRNEMVRNLAEQAKETFRQQLLGRAAAQHQVPTLGVSHTSAAGSRRPSAPRSLPNSSKSKTPRAYIRRRGVRSLLEGALMTRRLGFCVP